MMKSRSFVVLMMKGLNMKVIFWFTIICTTMLCSSVTADERSVLKALEKVKVGLESEASVENLREFLADAKVELNITRRETKNKCFLSNAEKSYELYDKAVQHKLEAWMYDKLEFKYKLARIWDKERELKKKKENAEKDLGEVKIKADLQLDKTYDCFK